MENQEPLHFHGRFSTIVHVEMVLSRHSGRVAQPRPVAVAGSLHIPELRCEIAIRGLTKLGGQDRLGEERLASAEIVARNAVMALPPQRLDSRSDGRGDLWVMTPAPGCDPPWTEHYAGRLDGGPVIFDCHVPVDTILDLALTPDVHETGSWSNVEVSGELSFPGSTRLRLAFRAPEHPAAPASESQRDEVVLIPAGTGLAIRQTMPSPAGRDAWLSLRILEPERRIVHAERDLSGPARSAA